MTEIPEIPVRILLLVALKRTFLRVVIKGSTLRESCAALRGHSPAASCKRRITTATKPALGPVIVISTCLLSIICLFLYSPVRLTIPRSTATAELTSLHSRPAPAPLGRPSPTQGPYIFVMSFTTPVSSRGCLAPIEESDLLHPGCTHSQADSEWGSLVDHGRRTDNNAR